MSYLGDYPLASTVYTTFRSIDSTGAGATLSGSPVVSVYKGSNTVEVTTGVTLTVDYDSRTGLNHLAIDTTDSFYATGNDFSAVITTGTVGGVSVVGTTVAKFSINNRSALRPTTSGRTLDVTATGGAGIDWSNVESPTTTLNLSGTTIKTATDVETDTQDIQSRLPAALVSGRIDSSVGAMQNNVITTASINDGAYTAAKFASGAFDAVWSVASRTLTAFDNSFKTGYALSSAGVQAIWDALTSAFVTVGSVGKRIVDYLNYPLDVINTKVEDARNAAQDTLAYVGVPATGTISGDIAQVKTATDDIQQSITDLSDNMDSRFTSVDTDLDSIQTAIAALPSSATISSDVWGFDVSGFTSPTTAGRNLYNLQSFVINFGAIQSAPSQTSIVLPSTASADNDAYNGCVVVIEDNFNSAKKCVGVISDYVGSTRTATLLNDPGVFTLSGDFYYAIIADRSLKSSVDNRTLDVSTTGGAGLDWSNVEAPTSTVNLTGTTVATSTTTGTVSGNVTGNVIGSVGSVVTPVNIAAGQIVVKKNTNLNNFEFLMLDSTNHSSGKTGLTITSTRSIDGGAFSATTNSAAEVGFGIYKINMSASDLNGNVITFRFTGTGADDCFVTIPTQP